MDDASSVAGACCSLVLPTLERQLGYTAKVGERVNELDKAMIGLRAIYDDVKKRIEEQNIDPTQHPMVEEWLRGVQEIEHKVNSIKADYEQIGCRCLGGCFSVNVYSNWKIGRKATKELVTVKDLSREEFDRVTRAGTPPPGQQLPGTSKVLAVNPNLQKVLGDLADGARTVGIWGMGGVGKTTLLKAINNQLSSDGGRNGMRFDHVIWVVVSNNVKIENVRADIAKSLKLPNHATDILKFLEKKKFIVLLDDVWEPLDLAAMGIPGHRVVLFTTRSEDVCGQMGADKKVKVECLQKEEAWRLFVDTVEEETISASPEIERLAKEVAEDCKGLPLALIITGRTMSRKRTPREWQHTLKSLKKSQPGTTCIEEDVFRILKYSYDSLPNEAARKCFLLCALYPEDYSFRIDELVNYFWGHGLIDVEGCNDAQEIFDRVYDKAVGVLKSACLLEDGDPRSEGETETVKMHDVIRDMALWIANDCGGNNTNWVVHAGTDSEEEPLKGFADWEMAERVSLMGFDKIQLPMPKRRCEKCSTLLLKYTTRMHIPKGYFDYFPALSYLHLSHTRIMELPDEVTSLTQLQYLDLSWTEIELLSISLQNLKKLKHLILRCCRYLSYIPYGLISCLPSLEYLDICGGSYRFKSSDSIGVGNDSDEESESEETQVTEEAFPPSANVDELKILRQRRRVKYLALSLKVKAIIDIENAFDVAWELTINVLHEMSVSLTMIARLTRTLKLLKLPRTEELILTSTQISRLFHLKLFSLYSLQNITWTKSVLLENFPRLTIIEIYACHRLRHLTWTGYLPRLETLEVYDCFGLEEIISAHENCNAFPNLRSLRLSSLPVLHSISNGLILSTKLILISVYGCQHVKRLPKFQQDAINRRTIDIFCDKKWWNGLEWDDATDKSYFSPSLGYFYDKNYVYNYEYGEGWRF